ncbi:MAG: DUF4330 family protein [Clostridia bacterium]|nr:DUF4330 family protein [Clostridia bacterium]
MSENTVKKVRRFKPNIIDLLIVVVVLGAIAGIALRMGVVEKVVANSSIEPARISFLVQDINSDSYNYFNVGDEFYSDTHKCYFGRLEEKPYDLPAEAFIAGADGSLLKAYSPTDPDDPSKSSRIDVRGKVISSGVFSSEGFLLGGTTYIAPGSKITVKSSNITVSITVTDIEKVNASE